MPNPPQTNCPKCGQPNAYDPKFVARPIKCTNCGQSFTAGFTPLQGAYVPPPRPPSRRNIEAIISLTCALLYWFFYIMTISMPMGTPQVAMSAMPIVSAVAAILLGIIGIVRTTDRRVKGRSLAIAGIMIAAADILINIVLRIYWNG